MSDILSDYSEWLGGWRPARMRTHYDRCHINHDACMVVRMAAEIASLRAEIARLRLTDAQREAIAWAARETLYYDSEDHPEVVAHAAALRGVLARHEGTT